MELHAAPGIHHAHHTPIAPVGPRPPEPPPPPAAQPASDFVASVAQHLPKPDVDRLLHIFEAPPPAVWIQQTEVLMKEAIHSAMQHSPQAVTMAWDLAAADPKSAAGLPSHPDLHILQQELERALYRLTTVARMEASQELARVADRAHTADIKIPGWHAPVRTLLAVAEQIFAVGGLENYQKTTRLALTLQENGALPLFEVPVPAAALPAPEPSVLRPGFRDWLRQALAARNRPWLLVVAIFVLFAVWLLMFNRL